MPGQRAPGFFFASGATEFWTPAPWVQISCARPRHHLAETVFDFLGLLSCWTRVFLSSKLYLLQAGIQCAQNTFSIAVRAGNTTENIGASEGHLDKAGKQARNLLPVRQLADLGVIMLSWIVRTSLDSGVDHSSALRNEDGVRSTARYCQRTR